jgi:hypothetical protein
MMSINVSNTDDDVPILDVTSNDNNDRQPLLDPTTEQSSTILSTPHVDMILVPSITRYRLTNILRVLLFVEFLTLLIIWLAGRHPSIDHSLFNDNNHCSR